ncbi:unnamed protein product [Paramecium pentaurelia]|uniref:Uncharacterized protein n=1 Tax=Paramecium pentaurelia TaxID=43138 RepID=A0A8S1Y263_9CILI|nr:unnamed protein product [Paramecium pentaurelia]
MPLDQWEIAHLYRVVALRHLKGQAQWKIRRHPHLTNLSDTVLELENEQQQQKNHKFQLIFIIYFFLKGSQASQLFLKLEKPQQIFYQLRKVYQKKYQQQILNLSLILDQYQIYNLFIKIQQDQFSVNRNYF